MISILTMLPVPSGKTYQIKYRPLYTKLCRGSLNLSAWTVRKHVKNMLKKQVLTELSKSPASIAESNKQ